MHKFILYSSVMLTIMSLIIVSSVTSADYGDWNKCRMNELNDGYATANYQYDQTGLFLDQNLVLPHGVSNDFQPLIYDTGYDPPSIIYFMGTYSGSSVLYGVYLSNLTLAWHYHAVHTGYAYGFGLHPYDGSAYSGDIYFGTQRDAGSYGELYCIESTGVERWHLTGYYGYVWQMIVPMDYDSELMYVQEADGVYVHYVSNGSYRTGGWGGTYGKVGTLAGDAFIGCNFAMYKDLLILGSPAGTGVWAWNMTTHTQQYLISQGSGWGWYQNGVSIDEHNNLMFMYDQGNTNRIEIRKCSDGSIEFQYSDSDAMMSQDIPIYYSGAIYFTGRFGEIRKIYTDPDYPLTYGKWKEGVNNVTITETTGSGSDVHFLNNGVIGSILENPIWWLLDSHGILYGVNVGDLTISYSVNVSILTGNSFDWYEASLCLYEDHFYIMGAPSEIFVLGMAGPSAPTLTIEEIGPWSQPYVDLSWTYPTNNGSSSLIGFKLYRSIDNITFYNINTLDNLTLIYRDSTIIINTEYQYYVLGYNINGNGEYSNIKSVNITLAVTVTTETGIVGQMLPFMLVLFLSLFVAIFLDKRFSLSMFLVCLGMMISVMVWLGGIPTFGISITVLVYSAVIWMAYSGRGSNE